MPDITAISAGINSIKLAMDITKGIKDASVSLKDAEIKFQIAELMTVISDVKINLLEAKDENLELKKVIKDLQKKLRQIDEVEYRDGYYYLKKPQTGKAEGPFCTNCFSEKDTLSLLSEVHGHFRTFGKYRCPSCDQRFGK